jgi:glucose-1-phosphate thymidylyltransferase
MNIIIPMAGWGTRLRPHSLTIPKPMLPIAGKPIVQRLAEDLMKTVTEKVENIAFIIRRDFGKKIEEHLIQVGKELNTPVHIFYQDEPLGTAHATLCAGDLLSGKIIVAFADTLFRFNKQLDTNQEGIIWVQKVQDPSAFGVVKINAEGAITDFVEKPKDFVSDLAIIGIYYFKDGAKLRSEMQYLIDNNIREKGEYQLTNALENLKQKGTKFVPGEVSDWLDCGNKNATVDTNQRYLEFIKGEKLVSEKAVIENSVIIQPSFIDEGARIVNSVIGPHVSIGKNTVVEDCIVRNSIIQSQSSVKNQLIHNSMVGNYVNLQGKFTDLSVGDYTGITE